MLNLIAAALVAAAPAPPADAHAQHQMGQMQPGKMGEMKPGKMAGMKEECACCKDMMAKMGGKHAGHDGASEQHQQ